MTFTALIVAGLLGSADFELQTLAGDKTSGQIVEMSSEQIVVSTSGERKTFPLASLAAVTQKDARPAEDRKADAWIELGDGSLLAVNNFGVRGKQATCQLAGSKLEVPTRSIRAIHFSSPADREDKLAKQWSDISGTKASGDLLVIRKNGELDYVEGIQGDIDAQTCKFEVDQEVTKVNRQKVEGILYFHPSAAELPEAIGEASLIDGTRVAMRAASLNSGVLKLATPAGIALDVPEEQILRLDFSSGKIIYLSDLEPESANYVPFLGFKEEPASIREYYQLRRDTGFDERPLQLDGATYAKGLTVPSRTSLTYKLPGRFKLFRTMLGIDDSVRETGSVRLAIKADGKSLWQGDVRGSEPPRELELKIEGVKRLEIVADYGEEQDIGDWLVLAEARVSK